MPPAQRGPDAGTVTEWLRWGWPGTATISVTRVRALTNDVWSVTADGQRYVAKVYGAGWRTPGEVAWELDLLDHLSARGVRVACAVRRHDGTSVSEFPAPDSATAVPRADGAGNARTAVLFDYAPGEKPQLPFGESLYRRFGRAVAAFHSGSADFRSSHHRAEIDLSSLVDRPIDAVQELLAPAEREFLLAFGRLLHDRLGPMVDAGLRRGISHGDATLDNLHVTADGAITLFDFDSGGLGWPASDLQGWAARDPAYSRVWRAFLDGYRTGAEVTDLDLAAAPWLAAAEEIGGLRGFFLAREAAHGEAALIGYLDAVLSSLRQFADALRSQY